MSLHAWHRPGRAAGLAAARKASSGHIALGTGGGRGPPAAGSTPPARPPRGGGRRRDKGAGPPLQAGGLMMEPHPGVFLSNVRTEEWEPDPEVPGSEMHELVHTDSVWAGLTRFTSVDGPTVWTPSQRETIH